MLRYYGPQIPEARIPAVLSAKFDIPPRVFKPLAQEVVKLRLELMVLSGMLGRV